MLNYFEGDRKLFEFVLGEIGDDIKYSYFTYGRACLNFAEKYGKDGRADAELVQAFTYIYKKMRNGVFPDAGSVEAKQEQEADSTEGSPKLEARLDRAGERARKAKKRKKEEEEKGEKPKSGTLYSRLGKEALSGVEADFFLINNINMKEYFQAVSVITEKDEDAGIPDALPFDENLTIEEMLLKECDSEETYLARIYMLLIEPFAKIQKKLDEEYWEEDDEYPVEEYEEII